MDEAARQLIQRIAKALDRDDGAAERLLEQEIEPFLAQAQANVAAGQTMLLMVRERIAARAATTAPPAAAPSNGGESEVDLNSHREKFRKTTARDGALLVLLEMGRVKLRKIIARMEELDHPKISNLSPALYKARTKTTPPLVTHDEDGYYALTDEGRKRAKALLK
jgi:hypothetical protein